MESIQERSTGGLSEGESPEVESPSLTGCIPTKKKIAKNAFLNSLSIAAPAAMALVMMPFLIATLGKSTYGLWLLIAAVLNWFALVDCGIRTAACRYFSLYRAKDNTAALNSTFSTSLVISVTGSGLIVLATIACAFVLPLLVDMPLAQIVDVRIAMFLAGIGLAISFPQAIFEAILYGWQQFGILSAINIFSLFVRFSLVLLLVLQGYGLIGLAVAYSISGIVCAGGKWISVRWLIPQVQFSFCDVSFKKARELFGFSSWNILRHVAKTALASMVVFIIGVKVSSSSVTIYTVAGRLVSYVTMGIQSVFGVLIPVSTAFHAQQDDRREKEFFLTGSKYCWMLSIYSIGGLLMFSKSFIILWLGNDSLKICRIAEIVAIGAFLPLSQTMTDYALVAKAKHQLLSLLMVIAACVALVISWFAVDQFGLIGIAIIVSVIVTLASFVECGLGCSVLKIPIIFYAKKSVLPALIISVPPLMFSAMANHRLAPGSWLALILMVGGYSSLFAISYLVSSGKFFRRNPVQCS